MVEYTCKDGTLELHRQPDAKKGRKWAERFAVHLGIPLVEAVENVFAVREAADLDRSVTEQGLAVGLEWPERQISDRLRWEGGRSGDVEISIEPPGPGWTTFMGALYVLGCAAAVIRFGSDLPGNWNLGTVLFLALLIPVFGLIAFIGVEAILASTVRVERWRVDRHGLGRTSDPASRMPSNRRTWAELLERTFAVDVLRCPHCGDRRRRIALITDPLTCRRLLRHIGARHEPLLLAPARPPPQQTLHFA